MDPDFARLVRHPAFLSLADHLPCVLYIGRPGWPPVLEFVSSNVERFTGCRPEEFYARSELFFDCVHPDDRARVAEETRQAMERPEPYRLEYRVVHRNSAEVYHAAMLSVPVLDPQGRVVRRQGVIVDVTEQKRLEAELLRSQRLAVIGEMARTMAHDIRNPLAGMGLALRALRGKVGADPEAAECLDDAVECMERIATTVMQAEEFAAGRPLMLEACSLDGMVAAACQRAERHLARRNVRLEAAVPPGLPRLAADPAQLEQAFVSLILHAARAMPEGGRIAISAQAQGARLAVELRANGVRTPSPDFGSLASDPGSRPAIATRVGLGVSLCQSILAAHGATLRAQGAAFHIEIPLEPAGATRSAD